ncbi:hypothetical protein HDV03_002951, partial [Kappamyces sp. JEL0829]
SSKFESLRCSIPLEGESATASNPLLFHPYDPYLLVADAAEIAVLDWESQSCLHVISNQNPPQSRITCMKFLNDEDASILLTGSTDGVVRLYRNYCTAESTLLLSAWRADTDFLPGSSGSLVCEWHQLSGVLYTSGAQQVIKIWDADEEICVQELPVRSPVSCFNVDTPGNLLLAGCNNGGISLFDRRLSSEKSIVESFQTPNQDRILDCKFSNADASEFISGNSAGDILLWDIRQSSGPIVRVETVPGAKSFFQIHEQAPLMACASSGPGQDTTIMNLKGRLLGTLKNTTQAAGFLGRGAVRLTNIAFHPRKLLLASSTSLGISLYSSTACAF